MIHIVMPRIILPMFLVIFGIDRSCCSREAEWSDPLAALLTISLPLRSPGMIATGVLLVCI
ncbi:hypothetical protein IVA78_06630 [Bradyrhizobium sp. 137]|uniref:hypothetical protein n=1 Tax=Bradyrhizobium sp. 137 TaxID=2782614 RepID=UPI001FFBF8E5|nr:hypothetical protein [Bradyrhizobium sp. 137]MCK1754887.1 hypothetical protein [Bradyrhizobium sp. 137]